jgi:hypothetical protein
LSSRPSYILMLRTCWRSIMLSSALWIVHCMTLPWCVGSSPAYSCYYACMCMSLSSQLVCAQETCALCVTCDNSKLLSNVKQLLS